MRAMRETGLFGEEPIEVAGADGGVVRVRPRDVTAKLMFPKWTYNPGEEDLTVMRITVVGVRAGRRVRVNWDLLDHFDRESAATSMSRTTAMPCTIMARMLLDGTVRGPGVHPPEVIARDEGVFDRMIRELAERRIQYRRTETPM
jgi:lysine 6-dehydrogenase